MVQQCLRSGSRRPFCLYSSSRPGCTSFCLCFFSAAYLLPLTGTRCRLAGGPANFHSEALWLRQRQAKAGSGAAEAKIGCPPSLHLLPTPTPAPSTVVLNHPPSHHHRPDAYPLPVIPSTRSFISLLPSRPSLVQPRPCTHLHRPPGTHALLAYLVVLDPSVAPFLTLTNLRHPLWDASLSPLKHAVLTPHPLAPVVLICETAKHATKDVVFRRPSRPRHGFLGFYPRGPAH